MKKYSYRSPETDRPPAAISALGRAIRAMSREEYLTSRQVFVLAFSPHESFECCKATMVTAQARDYVEKMPAERREGQYRLTDKGAAVRRAIEQSR